MVDHHALIEHQDFEETRESTAGWVSQQRGPCVQAELAGNTIGDESPGCVHMSAAEEMGSESREPAPQGLGVDQALAGQVPTIVARRVDRVVAGDDQPADCRPSRRQKFTGSFELQFRQASSGRVG